MHPEQIKAAMRMKGVTPTALADEMRVSNATMSQVISGRSVLVANAARYGAQFMLKPPRPPHWGGYRLVPDHWEFWQGRKSRLHDRLRYRLESGAWVRERLAP